MTNTTMHINSTAANKSGFNGLSIEEQIEMLEEIGSQALERALLRYLLRLDTEAQKQFTEFVKATIDSNINFLEMLYARYPEFESLLREEVVALRDASAALYETK